MPITEQRVDSFVALADELGSDEAALEEFLDITTPCAGEYVDEEKFRALIRSMWLSGNKPAIKKLLRTAFAGPTKVEAESEARKEIEGLQHVLLLPLLATIGFRRGDELEVRGADGKHRTLRLPDGLPE